MSSNQNSAYPQIVEYQDIRAHIQTGDIIVFGGFYLFSRIIKWITRSNASHVATILMDSEGQLRFFESTINLLNKNKHGVHLSRISECLPKYRGNIWIIKLHPTFREELDTEKMYEYLIQQQGKAYDFKGLIFSGLDILEKFGLKLTWIKRNDRKHFCSELVMEGYLAGNGFKENINPSEVTPIDIIRLQMYHHEYYMIKSPKNKSVKLKINTLPTSSLPMEKTKEV